MQKIINYFKNHSSLAAIIFFAIITVIYFYPSIFLGKVPLPTDLMDDYLLDQPKTGTNPLIRDALVQLYPYSDFIHQSFRQGKWPFYNEYIFNGLNFAASGQTSIFSPFNLLIPFFNSLNFFKIKIILFLWLAGFNLYYWLRQSRQLSFGVSLLGGLIWQLSGPLWAWQSWGTIVGVVIWLPLMLFSIDHFWQTNYKRYFIYFTFFNFYALTGSHLQFYIYVLLFTLAYFIYKVIINYKKNKINKIWLISFILINAAIIFLIIWPFLSNFSLSHRSRAIDTSHLSLENLPLWILPNYWGNWLTYKGPFNYTEALAYIGIVPFILIILLPLSLNLRKEKIFNFIKSNLFWLLTLAILLIYNFLPIGKYIPIIKNFPCFRSMFLINIILIFFACLSLENLKIKFKHYLFSIILFILIGFTLGSHYYFLHGYLPQQNPEPIIYPPAYVTFLQQTKNKPLIYSEITATNLYSLYNIRSIFGYDSSFTKSYYQSIKKHGKILSGRNILNAKITDYVWLKEIGVDYVVSKENVSSLIQLFDQDGIKVYQL